MVVIYAVRLSQLYSLPADVVRISTKNGLNSVYSSRWSVTAEDEAAGLHRLFKLPLFLGGAGPQSASSWIQTSCWDAWAVNSRC